MRDFFQKLDDLAGIKTENIWAKQLERVAFVFLVLMFLTAPHSIAASQTAWLIGMFVWLLRFAVKPRPRFVRTPLDIALWMFFCWSVISSIFSFAPDLSINKLRGTALFLIFYFVVNNLRNLRAVKFLAVALVFSCLVNVVWTPIQRIIGRGVEIHGVAAESPLAKALLIEGDTLLIANGTKIKSPEDLLAQIEQNETTKITFYRPDFDFAVDVKRENLLTGENALQKLGIENWKKSHNWRSSGFYGHYTTYAEVLQLIASLVFGLFIASFRRKKKDEVVKGENKHSEFLSFSFSYPLLFSFAAMSLALLLTVTRASQLALIVSAFSIVFLVNRKMLLILAAILLPVVIGGLVFLQQSRHVGFFDSNDDSTKYRQTMWRDGARIWTENPRNFLLGVGMDSTQRFWREWNMFDGGKLPLGHFHSTPLQLLVERGLPALLLWLWILWIYGRTLLRKRKFSDVEESKIFPSWIEKGIILGCFGGMIGFFTSGLVHYNLGDQEVEMVFFMLMGLGISLVTQDSRFMLQNYSSPNGES
ncbi:hypothetical protein BH10ACI1_BH10ACI1_04590 [soil metagenome]